MNIGKVSYGTLWQSWTDFQLDFCAERVTDQEKTVGFSSWYIAIAHQLLKLAGTRGHRQFRNNILEVSRKTHWFWWQHWSARFPWLISTLSLLVCICADSHWAQACEISQKAPCLLIQAHCLISLLAVTPVFNVMFSLCASQSQSDNCFWRTTACFALSACYLPVLSLLIGFRLSSSSNRTAVCRSQHSGSHLSEVLPSCLFFSCSLNRAGRFSKWKNFKLGQHLLPAQRVGRGYLSASTQAGRRKEGTEQTFISHHIQLNWIFHRYVVMKD